MSGLLSRCPPLRAQAHTAQTRLFALFSCALSACPRRVSLRFVRAGRLCKYAGSRAHTWLRPHAAVWARSLCSLGGVLAEACCGRVCSVGGWVWCLRYCPCSPFGVCAFGVGALVGWWDSSVSPPRFFACLRAHALVWAALAWAALAWAAGWAATWGGTTLSRPTLRGGAVPVVWRGERREKGGVLAGWWVYVPGVSALVAGATRWWSGRGGDRLLVVRGLASVWALIGLGVDWVACLPSWWWGWAGGDDFPR